MLKNVIRPRLYHLATIGHKEKFEQLQTNNKKQAQRIKELEDEIQEVSNQLMDLYDKCNETTEPEVYGTILGLHERLDKVSKYPEGS